jgi:hypothetical protein
MLQKNAGYDPLTSFDPIALVAQSSNILVVHPSVPVGTVQELVGYPKANPGKVNFSSGGIGVSPHFDWRNAWARFLMANESPVMVASGRKGGVLVLHGQIGHRFPTIDYGSVERSTRPTLVLSKKEQLTGRSKTDARGGCGGLS